MMRLALRALLDETSEKPDQVIVVNGGDERTDKLVAEYSGRNGVDMQLIKTMNVNLATSRNIGIPLCSGEIVAMTDDDAEVYPDWVTQMKRVHAEHPTAGAVGGAIIGANSGQSLISRLSDIVTFPMPTEPREVRTLPGVNVSYKRAVLQQIGPQDETLIRSEDVDFNWRVKLAGYTVFFDPAIKVKHHHRPTLRRFIYQHYMYGRGYYLVRRKYPEMYCIYPHGFRRRKDFLKVGNFFAATIYDPLLNARRLPTLADKVRGVPILLVNQIAWRMGIIHQARLTSHKRTGTS